MRNLWTEQEDLKLMFLVKNITSMGVTFKQSFEDASEQLGRTTSACRSRWYRKVKKTMNEMLQNIFSVKNKEKQKVTVSRKNKKETVMV